MNDTKKTVKRVYRKPRIVHEEGIEARAGGCGKTISTSGACGTSGVNS